MSDTMPEGAIPTSVENGGTEDGRPWHQEGTLPEPKEPQYDEEGRLLNDAGQPAPTNIQPGGPADRTPKMTPEERQLARSTQNPDGAEAEATPDPDAVREHDPNAKPVHASATPDPIHIVSQPQQG